jgi:hypothetical protein
MVSWGQIQTAAIDPYPAGHFVFSNNGNDFALLSTLPWTSFDGGDLAFELRFTGGPEPSPGVVPEPSTVLLMGTGMGILLLGSCAGAAGIKRGCSPDYNRELISEPQTERAPH